MGDGRWAIGDRRWASARRLRRWLRPPGFGSRPVRLQPDVTMQNPGVRLHANLVDGWRQASRPSPSVPRGGKHAPPSSVGGIRGDPTIVTPPGSRRLRCGFRAIRTALLTGLRQSRLPFARLASEWTREFTLTPGPRAPRRTRKTGNCPAGVSSAPAATRTIAAARLVFARDSRPRSTRIATLRSDRASTPSARAADRRPGRRP